MYYIAGVDSAPGGVGRTKMGEGRTSSDDFAIATIRADESGPAEVVDVYRENGLTDYQMSAVVHRKHQKFNYELIMMDPNGGGLFVRDKLRDPEQYTGAQRFMVRPLITRDDEQMRGAGDPRLVLFGRSDSRISGDPKDPKCPGAGLLLSGESVLPNKMHELMRAALESTPQGIHFPEKWPGWQGAGTADDMRSFLTENKGLSERNRAHAEIDLALAQLIQVDRKMDPDMVTIHQDKFGLYEFISGEKKDSAYALLYAYFGLWLLRTELNLFRRKEKPKSKIVIVAEDA